jgi:hypothetical protein
LSKYSTTHVLCSFFLWRGWKITICSQPAWQNPGFYNVSAFQARMVRFVLRFCFTFEWLTWMNFQMGKVATIPCACHLFRTLVREPIGWLVGILGVIRPGLCIATCDI